MKREVTGRNKMRYMLNTKKIGCKSFLLLFSLFSFSLFAGTDYTVETIPNVRLTDRNNHVSNPDGILRPQDVSQINLLLQSLEDSLGIEVAVVAVESIGGQDARMFATDLFNKWGLGKKNKDNGLLIQLITEPTQRSVVFETGYGLEGVLSDAICYRLQQRYMIPDLKAGQYSEGMLKGVASVKEYLLASDYERTVITGEASSDEEDIPFIILVITIALLVLTGTIFPLLRRSFPKKCPRCGKKTLVYGGQRVIQAATYHQKGISEEIWHCTNCNYTEKKSITIEKLRRTGGPIVIGGGGRGFGGPPGGFGGGSWGGGSSGGGGSISRF